MTIHKHRGLCSFDSRVGVGHTLGCALPRQVSPGLLAGNEAQGDQIAGVVGLPRLVVVKRSQAGSTLVVGWAASYVTRHAASSGWVLKVHDPAPVPATHGPSHPDLHSCRPVRLVHGVGYYIYALHLHMHISTRCRRYSLLTLAITKAAGRGISRVE